MRCAIESRFDDVLCSAYNMSERERKRDDTQNGRLCPQLIYLLYYVSICLSACLPACLSACVCVCGICAHCNWLTDCARTRTHHWRTLRRPFFYFYPPVFGFVVYDIRVLDRDSVAIIIIVHTDNEATATAVVKQQNNRMMWSWHWKRGHMLPCLPHIDSCFLFCPTAADAAVVVVDSMLLMMFLPFFVVVVVRARTQQTNNKRRHFLYVYKTHSMPRERERAQKSPKSAVLINPLAARYGSWCVSSLCVCVILTKHCTLHSDSNEVVWFGSAWSECTWIMDISFVGFWLFSKDTKDAFAPLCMLAPFIFNSRPLSTHTHTHS